MKLPVELWIRIFRCVEPKTAFHSLLLVSRHIHDICEPLVYYKVTLRPQPEETGHHFSSRIEAFHRVVVANDGRLGAFVREFVLDYADKPFFDPNGKDNYHVQHIMPLLHHVQRFKYNSLADGTPKRILTLHPFANHLALTHFAWNYLPSRFVSLAAFLQAHPMLEHLEVLGEVEPDFTLSAEMLPRLRVLAGSSSVVVATLPSRCIARLHIRIVHATSWSFPLPAPIQDALAHVRSLSVDCDDAKLCFGIASHCVNADFLRVTSELDYVIACLSFSHSLVSCRMTHVRYLQIVGRETIRLLEYLRRETYAALPNLCSLDMVDGQLGMKRFNRDGTVSSMTVSPSDWGTWDPREDESQA